MGKGSAGPGRRIPLSAAQQNQFLRAKAGYAWRDVTVKAARIAEIMAQHEVPEIVARVAAAMDSKEESINVDYLLDPSISRMRALTSVPDQSGFAPRAAIARLRRAIESGERIGIHGDYDSDGVMSSLILRRALLHYVAREQVELFLPDRSTGYGFRVESLRILIERGCSVVITTDCGTTDHETAHEAKAKGIDLIVIDHHQIDEHGWISDGIVLNPHTVYREEPATPEEKTISEAVRPFRSMCASGLAWKVARELHLEMLGEIPTGLEDDLAYAAVGSIADVVPLTYENRIVVYHGLRAMRGPDETLDDSLATEPLDLIRQLNAAAYNRPLKDEEGKDIGNGYRVPLVHDVAMKVTPLLNLGKRVADDRVQASRIFELVSGELTRAEMQRRLHDLGDVQEAKQRAQAQYTSIARKQAKEQRTSTPDRRAVYIRFDGCPDGLCGPIASTIMERERKPVFVVTNAREKENGRLFGSARAFYPWPLLELVREVAAENAGSGGDDALVLSRFGGHREVVGGLRVQPDRWDEFVTAMEAKFTEWESSVMNEEQKKQGPATIHAEVRLADWNADIVRQIQHELGPYGQGCPEPIFVSRNVRVAEKREEKTKKGTTRVNVGYTFEQNGTRMRGESHQSAQIDDEMGESGRDARDMREGAIVNIMYTVGLDRSGEPFLRLKRAEEVAPPKVRPAAVEPVTAEPVAA